MRLDLRFADDSTRKIDHTFVEPVVAESGCARTLSHQLQTLSWPAELESMELSLLECGELSPHSSCSLTWIRIVRRCCGSPKNSRAGIGTFSFGCM